MSFPVNPVGNVTSQPKVVSLPQTQRIVQDIIDCMRQLKEDFVERKSPITDDNEVLRRFCAKLEYLLQYEMKERYSLLGKRKDYWDYFCDCLASNKGANDGIKYVKSLGEHKTSLGKGRAFIRFALVHQRLADGLQQCIINSKTGEWYNTASVWMQSKVSSSIIGNLYDLNDLHFDLSPRGYDLDNAWPSFAMNSQGVNNWNVPVSRRSSITSMDTLSLVSTDPVEINRLQQELASTETARSALAESVSTLEQERQRAEQSVWMTQGELNAMQEQLKSSAAKFRELQQQYTALEQSHTKLQAEKTEQEQQIAGRATELNTEQQRLAEERERLTQQQADLTQQLADERARSSSDADALQQVLNGVTEARDKLTSKVASLEENVEQMRSWDAKKDQQIARLEQQTATLEQRNSELMEELAKNLSSREQDAASQLESAQKFHDLLSKLKDVEADNVKLQAVIVDLKHRSEVSEKTVREERSKGEDLQSKLTAELKKYEVISSDLKGVTAQLEQEKASSKVTVDKLQSDLKLVQEESERTRAELSSRTETFKETEARQANLTKFISQLMQLTLDSSGAKVKSPDVSLCSKSEMTNFVETCQKSSAERLSDLQCRLEASAKKEAALSTERDLMHKTVDSIVHILPDKPDSSITELPQLTREVEARVQSLCTQLSDAATNNSFLKEQLQLAQGEHSDKGKQLSHLEGRLSELEKVLKESRASESSLQGQVASMEVTLKNTESQNQDLQSRLQTALADISTKSENLNQVSTEKVALEKRVQDQEKRVEEWKASAEALSKEREASGEREESLKARVQGLESSVESAHQQLEDKTLQLSSLQEKVKEGEETVEKFLASMASLETDKASIVTEQDSLRQQLADVSTQFQTAVMEKQQEQAAKEEVQLQFARLQENHSSLKESLNERDSEVKSLQESLQGNLQSNAEETEQLKKQLENSLAEFNQTKTELDQAHAKLSEVTSLKESAEAEREAKDQKLQETSSKLTEKEVTFSEEVQNLRMQLENLKTEKEELRKSSSSSQEETTKLLSEKQSVVARLQEEKMDIEKQVKDLSQKNKTLEAEMNKTQVQVDELKQVAESDKEKSASKLEQTQSQLQKEIDHLTQQNTGLNSQLEKVQNDLQRKLEEIQETQVELETTKNLSERLRSDSASEKSELEDSLEKLQSRFSELQTAMDVIIKEKEDLTASQVAAQEEITELKADLASSSDGYNFLLQSSQKVQEDKDGEIESLKSQLAELERNNGDLDTKLQTSSSQTTSLEEKLQKLVSAEQAWKEKETELENTLKERNIELEELRNKEEGFTSSVSDLEEKDRTWQHKVEELETTLQEKENTYTTQVESLQQELSALQFQLSAEQLQHEESLRAMGDSESSAAEMSGRLAEQEAMISDMEKELSSMQTGFETERTNQNQQLDELKVLVKAKETECRLLAEKLQRIDFVLEGIELKAQDRDPTSDKLEETLSSAELYQKENSVLRKSLDHDIEEREEEIRTLRSDNEQLKKQLVKAVRDKAVLWQQTDALAYEHKRKSEGKWLDNSTVTKCMGCTADFSLFLRKHHCRLCGQIFCFNCSDNWVDSTSSSRKARACKQCYSDLQNLDASITKASLLPEDSDDENSNVGSDVNSQQDSITDDRPQSSLQQAMSPSQSPYPGSNDDAISPATPEEDIYSSRTSNSPDLPDLTSTPQAPTVPSDTSVSESASQDGTFQVITQEEVTKSIAAYDDGAGDPQSLIDVPNMSSSMLLSAEDLAKGEINTQNETVVKPGCSFAVPIAVDTPYTLVSWEFTVHPKDIQFSITYHQDGQQPVSQAEVVVAPTRCNSVQEPVRGELTAKQAGVYTLVFDNSYSRMTSKKVHYTLKYDR